MPDISEPCEYIIEAGGSKKEGYWNQSVDKYIEKDVMTEYSENDNGVTPIWFSLVNSETKSKYDQTKILVKRNYITITNNKKTYKKKERA